MGAPIVSCQPVGLGACGHGVPAVCVGSVQPIARSKPQERPPASDPLKSPTAPVQTKPVPQAQEPNQRLTQSPSSFTIKAPGNAPTRTILDCQRRRSCGGSCRGRAGPPARPSGAATAWRCGGAGTGPGTRARSRRRTRTSSCASASTTLASGDWGPAAWTTIACAPSDPRRLPSGDKWMVTSGSSTRAKTVAACATLI